MAGVVQVISRRATGTGHGSGGGEVETFVDGIVFIAVGTGQVVCDNGIPRYKVRDTWGSYDETADTLRTPILCHLCRDCGVYLPVCPFKLIVPVGEGDGAEHSGVVEGCVEGWGGDSVSVLEEGTPFRIEAFDVVCTRTEVQQQYGKDYKTAYSEHGVRL